MRLPLSSSLRASFHPVSLLPVAFLLLVTTLTPISLHASAAMEILPDSQGLLQMEQRALQASPREQCFLYTELVHTMTEIAGRQMLDGDADQASATLKRVEHYAQLIHLGLATDSKRVKNAEMLMHHTTFRLSSFLRAASGDDRATLQSTLKQLDQVEEELMTQVFRH